MQALSFKISGVQKVFPRDPNIQRILTLGTEVVSITYIGQFGPLGSYYGLEPKAASRTLGFFERMLWQASGVQASNPNDVSYKRLRA